MSSTAYAAPATWMHLASDNTGVSWWGVAWSPEHVAYGLLAILGAGIFFIAQGSHRSHRRNF